MIHPVNGAGMFLYHQGAGLDIRNPFHDSIHTQDTNGIYRTLIENFALVDNFLAAKLNNLPSHSVG